jgi:hypothetical protein
MWGFGIKGNISRFLFVFLLLQMEICVWKANSLSVEVRICLSRLASYSGIDTVNTNISAKYANLAYHSLFLRCVLKLTVTSLPKGY